MPRHDRATPRTDRRRHMGHRMHRRNRPARRFARRGNGRLNRTSPWGRWGVSS